MIANDERAKRLRFRFGAWASAGFVGGLTLVCIMLSLRLSTNTPPQVLRWQDPSLQVIPGPLFGFLIDRLQFWGKPIVLTLSVAAFVMMGTGVSCGLGVIFERRGGVPGFKHLLTGGILAGICIWFLSESALLALRLYADAAIDLSAVTEAAAVSVVSFIAYGVAFALIGVLSLQERQEKARTYEAPTIVIGRRNLLVMSVGGVAALLAGIGLSQMISAMGGRSTVVGADVAESTGATVLNEAASQIPTSYISPKGVSEEITPNEKFYVVSKNSVDPNLDAATWSLEIGGLVKKPLRLSYRDILAKPPTHLLSTLECISNGVGGNLISTTRWTGVRLSALLDEAALTAERGWLEFTTADGFRQNIPIDIARQSTTILAHSMNGEALTRQHGFPVRLISTGFYGMKNPKWITKITVVHMSEMGFWEQLGWEPGEGVETMARFDTWPGVVTVGTTVLLGGIAFAGDPGITRVEVSDDRGASWSQAALKPPLSPHTWVLWSFPWRVRRPGTYNLLVRAVDGFGVTQTFEKNGSFPTGATGYHQIAVEAKRT